MKEQEKEILKQKVKERLFRLDYTSSDLVIGEYAIDELIDSIPVTDSISKSHVLERLDKLKFELCEIPVILSMIVKSDGVLRPYEEIRVEVVENIKQRLSEIDQLKKELS
jgi:hypothetical protein